MKIVVSPNPYRDKQFKHARQACQILKEAGAEVSLCLPFDVDRSFEIPSDLRFREIQKEIRTADMLICFGGDGTILHSSKIATEHGLPILGVNIGTMGFIAELEASEMELLRKIPTKKLSTKRLKPLTYLKYVILVVMVFLLPVLVVNEAGMGDPFFCKYLCPQGVLEGAIPLSLVNSSIRAALGKLFSWKLCVLITVVVLSVIFYRPFCKWLCPLGAFYALFNRVSLLSMHVDESKCVSCGKCARTCPMDVDVTKTPNHSECIRCGKCVTACPTEAVRFRYAFGSGGACSKLSQKPIIEENKGE